MKYLPKITKNLIIKTSFVSEKEDPRSVYLAYFTIAKHWHIVNRNIVDNKSIFGDDISDINCEIYDIRTFERHFTIDKDIFV